MKRMTKSTELLEGLLRIYSPSYHEQEAVEYLVAQMNALGLRAFRDEAGNAVGIIDPPTPPLSKGGQGGVSTDNNGGRGGVPAAPEAEKARVREIVMLGHIDTAPGIVPVRRETGNGGGSGLLYGRGSVDAKGPLCAFASAAANVGAREGWRIIVVGAVEEECPTSKGAHFAKGCYAPEYAIVGEPSGWDRVTLGYKGSLWVTYLCRRAEEHTAGKHKSVAEEAVDFWLSIKQYSDVYNQDKVRVFDKLDPTLRGMSSNSDGLFETAELSIGLRLPVGVQVHALEEAILEMAGNSRIQFSTETAAFRADKNNALVRAFLASIRAGGGEPGFTVKTGTSDMNILGPYWACPIVTYGPGDSNLDHTPDEHIELDEYGKSITVLAGVLDTLTAAPRP